MAPVAAAAILILAPASAATAASVEITACGQVIASGNGFLEADLDCTGHAGPGVALSRGTSLDLRGHVLSGGDGNGIECTDKCLVTSRFEDASVEGFAGHGIVVAQGTDSTPRVTVRSIAVRDNGGSGILVDAPAGNASVRRVEITGNGDAGVSAPGFVRAGACTVSDNTGVGLSGGRMLVKKATIQRNAVGIVSTQYLLVNTVEVSENIGDGIQADKAFKSRFLNSLSNGGTGLVMASIDGPARVFFTEISDNGGDGIRVDGSHIKLLFTRWCFVRRNAGSGIVSHNLRATFTRADDNGLFGVVGLPNAEGCKLRLNRFSMSGNATDAACGVSQTCADIASCDELMFFHPETACATSYDTNSGFPGTSLGVCPGD